MAKCCESEEQRSGESEDRLKVAVVQHATLIYRTDRAESLEHLVDRQKINRSIQLFFQAIFFAI